MVSKLKPLFFKIDSLYKEKFKCVFSNGSFEKASSKIFNKAGNNFFFYKFFIPRFHQCIYYIQKRFMWVKKFFFYLPTFKYGCLFSVYIKFNIFQSYYKIFKCNFASISRLQNILISSIYRKYPSYFSILRST